MGAKQESGRLFPNECCLTKDNYLTKGTLKISKQTRTS